MYYLLFYLLENKKKIVSKFDHEWQKFFQSKKQPEALIEDYLIRLEKLDNAEFAFWRDFHAYLVEEREKKFDEIQSALERTQRINLSAPFSRIVLSDYNNDPLCVYGSICEPGRFNFGALPSYYNNFGALYLANNASTAHSEVFYYDKEEEVGEGKLSSEEMSLDPTRSHLYVRTLVELETYLDLREDYTLQAFLDVVKTISPGKEFPTRWRALCKKRGRKGTERELRMVRDLPQFKASIFDSKFKQWISWLDCPSHSQWLGHYAVKCGIQGIIYPSVRNDTGYNIAVFPDTFRDSPAKVKLVDKVASVPQERTYIDNTNYLWLSKPIAEKTSEQ